MKNGNVPKDPDWCVHCYQRRQDGKGPCEDHQGPDGPVPYTGAYKHEPSDWVKSVVGKKYIGYRDGPRVWLCWGYDPRAGFWMRTCDEGPLIETNVSERAIDRTYHTLRMNYGAWRLLAIVKALGRFPTTEEASDIMLDLASTTLRRHGFLDADMKITEAGRVALARYPNEDDRYCVRVV